MRRSFLLLPLLAVGCTPDYDLSERKPAEDGGPQIELDPTSLFFGTAEVGTALEQTFTINSIGDTVATIDRVEVEGPEAFSVTTFAARISSGDSRDVVVTYTATGEEDQGEVHVYSDDPESPHTVTLNGGGLSPQLTIDPGSHDYGYVEAGSSDDFDFTLSNTGGATLEITAIGTTESVFEASRFDSLPISLEPGEETTVTVTYSPTDGSTWSGLLEVGSNDPAGLRTADLNGSGAVDQPIAVCDVYPATVVAISDTATWRGNNSYDPSGAAIIDYDWTLVTKPSGSAATMPSGGANRSGFSPDVVGTYEAELVVTNEYGERSEPCTATLTAEPSGDFWVEMYWTRSGDDMDLHLVAPGGSLVGSSDCYFANCTSGLDWGTRGDTSDNPYLDLDDIAGTGPENINIDAPQNGTFTVYVHDYPSSVYNGNNDVTVNIYIGGVLEWSDTRNVNSEDHYEPFAEIDWPSGTVTSL
jgi:hypothetical protein